MAAPTKSCDVKKVLANSEPSTHGTQRLFARLRFMTGLEVQRTWLRAGAIRHFDPKRRGGVAIKSSELVGQAHAPDIAGMSGRIERIRGRSKVIMQPFGAHEEIVGHCPFGAHTTCPSKAGFRC